MAKFFRFLKSQKLRSTSSPSSGLGKKKKEGIFRSTSSRRKSTKTTFASPVIEAAITYSLSEDEEWCNPSLSSENDIENQLSVIELDEEYFDDHVMTFEKTTDSMTTKEIAEVEPGHSIQSETKNNRVVVKENDKSMTFTHLEIMRNELAHMMQIAEKDKEIHQLQYDNEELKIQHAAIVAAKDAEITSIKNSYTEMESALSTAENKLAAEEREHSKTIEFLMQTQCEYYELNSKSCLQSLFCFN